LTDPNEDICLIVGLAFSVWLFPYCTPVGSFAPLKHALQDFHPSPAQTRNYNCICRALSFGLLLSLLPPSRRCDGMCKMKRESRSQGEWMIRVCVQYWYCTCTVHVCTACMGQNSTCMANNSRTGQPPTQAWPGPPHSFSPSRSASPSASLHHCITASPHRPTRLCTCAGPVDLTFPVPCHLGCIQDDGGVWPRFMSASKTSLWTGCLPGSSLPTPHELPKCPCLSSSHPPRLIPVSPMPTESLKLGPLRYPDSWECPQDGHGPFTMSECRRRGKYMDKGGKRCEQGTWRRSLGLPSRVAVPVLPLVVVRG
jgi:hypothetical protein